MRTTLLGWHIAAAILHGLLAISSIVSILLPQGSGSQSVAVFDSWPQWDPKRCNATFGESSVPICPQTCPLDDNSVTKLADINMSVVIIVSQVVTCLAHCYQSYCLAFNDSTYLSLTKEGIKFVFWGEYVITGSTIAYIIFYYSGMIDVKTQSYAISAQSTLMFLGLLLDVLRYVSFTLKQQFRLDEAKVLRWMCVPVFLVGFSNVLTVWLPSIIRLSSTSTGAPSWVVWVVIAESLLYMSFGIVQLGFFLPFMKTGDFPSQRSIMMENIALVILSFVSKALLNMAFSICLVYGLCQGDD